MLTIFNLKTGVVKQENLGTVAPGQVLLQHCSEEFIQDLANNPDTWSEILGSTEEPAATPKVTQAEIDAAKATLGLNEKPCCTAKGPCKTGTIGGTSTCDLETDPEQLRDELTELLTDNGDFIETLRQEVRDSDVLNPGENRPTTNNIMDALALYAHYGIDNDFRSGETVVGNANRLAKDFRILEVTSGTLAQTRYQVNSDFADLILDTMQDSDNAEFEELFNQVLALQEQIENLE